MYHFSSRNFSDRFRVSECTDRKRERGNTYRLLHLNRNTIKVQFWTTSFFPTHSHNCCSGSGAGVVWRAILTNLQWPRLLQYYLVLTSSTIWPPFFLFSAKVILLPDAPDWMKKKKRRRRGRWRRRQFNYCHYLYSLLLSSSIFNCSISATRERKLVLGVGQPSKKTFQSQRVLENLHSTMTVLFLNCRFSSFLAGDSFEFLVN